MSLKKRKRDRRNIINEYYLNGKYEGHIYVGFLNQKDCIFKIGRAKDLYERLYKLKLKYGDEFEYYTFSKPLWNCAIAETVLHESLCEPISNDKYTGEEWFYLGNMDIERLLADIERLEIASDEMYEFE